MVKRKAAERHSRSLNVIEHQGPQFWSGVITFGLVSLAVCLLPSSRRKPAGSNPVEDGEYPSFQPDACESTNMEAATETQPSERPIGQDPVIVVDDDQLSTLIFGKHREIGLRRFVPMNEIDPDFFEQSFIFAPEASSGRAYRLLAKSMVEENRAGIATFVKGDREYLVAIMAERDLLRVETMRLDDEIRHRPQTAPAEHPRSPDTPQWIGAH